MVIAFKNLLGNFGHTLYSSEVAPAFDTALVLCVLASIYSSSGCMRR
jgi:hypothetical protein